MSLLKKIQTQKKKQNEIHNLSKVIKIYPFTIFFSYLYLLKKKLLKY